jgi:hypothetical protein
MEGIHGRRQEKTDKIVLYSCSKDIALVGRGVGFETSDSVGNFEVSKSILVDVVDKGEET